MIKPYKNSLLYKYIQSINKDKLQGKVIIRNPKMFSSSENPINQLSRQLRRENIEFPVRSRTVGSSQVVQDAAEEWTFGILRKLMWKHKIDMRTIRQEINSLWRSYRDKQIIVMGQNLMLVKLNSEEERDEVLLNGPWIVGEALFAVQKYTNGVPISEYKFTHQIFTL